MVGGGRAIRALALVLLGLGLAACGGLRSERRALPADRGASVLYVALGDSTVEGVGASRPEASYVARLHRRLRAVYPGARVVNLGVAGARSSDVLNGQLRRALELGPDLVTISVGPNDITGGVGAGDFEINLERILAALTRETRAVVVVNLLPDLAVTPRFAASPARETVGRLTAEFNAVLRRAGRAHGAALVDLYEASRREVPRRPELVAGDGYHPSDAGYALWAELMWRGVQPHIAVCAGGGEAAWRPC